VAYHASGHEQAKCGVFPRVLWLTLTAARAEVIEDCLQALTHADRELFQITLFKDAIGVLTNGRGIP
jgi:hypothetical protein